MHIMFIPSWYRNSRNKVHGSFFKEQALAINDNGIKITVAYNEIWPITMMGKIKEKSGLSYEVDDGLHTYRFKGYNYIPKHPFMFKVFNYRMEKLYKEVVKKEGKVDIIHAQSSLWGGISAEYIAKKYNIPLVITEHSSIERGKYVRKSYLPAIIKSYKNADKIIAVGNGLRKEIEKLTDKNDVVVIPNLVDISRFKLKSKKDNKDFTFFSLAFLEGEKGFDTLIKAFARAFDNKDVKLIIGGDGSQKAALEALTKKYGLENQVSFLGALSRDEVSIWMQQCNAFVLPSRYETFGVVYIEALASGTPVIGAYNGGAEDIINEKNGYIVNVDNVKELSEAMLKMIENIDKFDGKELRNECIKKYHPVVIAEKIISVYKEVSVKGD